MKPKKCWVCPLVPSLAFFVIVRGCNQEYLIPTSFGVDNIYDARNLIVLVLLLLWKKHHDQGNWKRKSLIEFTVSGAYRPRGQNKDRVAGTAQTVHHDPQARGREAHWKWHHSFEMSKLTTVTTCPARSDHAILSKHFQKLETQHTKTWASGSHSHSNQHNAVSLSSLRKLRVKNYLLLHMGFLKCRMGDILKPKVQNTTLRSF